MHIICIFITYKIRNNWQLLRLMNMWLGICMKYKLSLLLWFKENTLEIYRCNKTGQEAGHIMIITKHLTKTLLFKLVQLWKRVRCREDHHYAVLCCGVNSKQLKVILSHPYKHFSLNACLTFLDFWIIFKNCSGLKQWPHVMDIIQCQNIFAVPYLHLFCFQLNLGQSA